MRFVLILTVIGLLAWLFPHSLAASPDGLAARPAPLPTPIATDDDDHDNGQDRGDDDDDTDSETDDDEKEEDEKEDDELVLDLEKLFPERTFFGPAAHGMAFSHDGRYAAYLYRPYKERRHGSDLWLYDTETGESQRITSPTVMAQFQKSAREVARDRREKARKAGMMDKNNDDDDNNDNADDSEENNDNDNDNDNENETNTNHNRNWGDWVSDDDAEDSDAPRYSGIQSFRWSPTDNEMLVVSRGDIYRFIIETDQPEEPTAHGLDISRLTMTNDNVRGVQYWPDGSGYTYMQGGSLLKVTFGSHLIKQLDPDLPRGESMTGYRVSPDGQRMVFLTSRVRPGTGSDRTVTIVDYRQRFARAREVRRTVSDDPQTQRDVSIYLYEMGDPFHERSKLARVFTDRQTRPRDVIRVPHWSPDSTRVTFSIFEQDNSQVAIYEAWLTLNNEDEDDADEHNNDENGENGENENSNNNSNGNDDDDSIETEEDAELDIEVEEAREVYRFLHYGGPNTPSLIEPRYLADNRRIVFLAEKSGYRHLHRLDPLYQAVDQLTTGRFEIYPIDVDPDHTRMFAWGTAEHMTRQDVYRVCLEDGGLTRLTTNQGRYMSPAVCPKGEHVLANFVTYGELRELVAIRPDDETHTVLTDSHPDKAHQRTRPVPEFFTYKNRLGHEIHGKMFKPDDWSPDDKRPLLIYVYGGPLSSNRKQVIDGSYGAPNYFFAYYMAKKHGYVTVTIDPRGTSGYGGLFEKASFQQVGRPQAQDLVDGVHWLVEHHGVDPDRVGMHGWSFGGFQTQKCMYTKPDVFHVGIAGAGPTEWHNYNSWYSTGTIGDSRKGETDLEEFSLIPLAKNLKGRLLLVHGMEDANVLYQDTVKVYAALLEAGKETNVELFLDPTGGHGLGGHVKTLNRYRKYEDFLLIHLGNGAATQTIAEDEEADEHHEDDKDEDEVRTIEARLSVSE